MACVSEQPQGPNMEEPSPHIWSAPGVPVNTMAPSQPDDNFQIMYCKDQVYQTNEEFSFEELRAQRYYKAQREMALHVSRKKQELQRRIEQKLSLLKNSTAAPQQQEANSSTQKPAGSCESAANTVKSAPFVIYSEQEEGRAVSSSSVSREDGMNQSESDAKLQKTATAKPFTIFNEDTQTHKISSVSREDSMKQSGIDAKLQKTATAKPFAIFSENTQTDKTKSSVSREDSMSQSGSDAKLQKTATAKPFAFFSENTQTDKPSSSANRNSLKLPTLCVKPPKSKVELVTDKDASISRSEEAIINGHWNKTLCRSPNDTCEFARAAQLASSPFGGVDRQKTSNTGLMGSRADTESTKAANTDATPEEKKLSPILEISQEWGASMFSQDPMKHSNDTEVSPEVELENVSKWQEVCSPNVRSRLFDQIGVTSFSNFHQRTGLLPDTSEDLQLDGETLLFRRKLRLVKDFCLYTSKTGPVLLKTDSLSVPWDFFISSQLRSRGSSDEQDRVVQISCHVFENGSITLWRIPNGHTYQDLLSKHINTSLMVILLLELVKRFHSCQLVHGGLKPESLYFYYSGIMALDFANSVDLHLQTDVRTAQDLPSAQPYIQQGLLSPSASPYQVDLMGIAEVTHWLLFNRPLEVKLENSVWSLKDDSSSQHGAPVEPLWREFFHMILNPDKSSELVLSDLIHNVRNSS